MTFILILFTGSSALVWLQWRRTFEQWYYYLAFIEAGETPILGRTAIIKQKRKT